VNLVDPFGRTRRPPTFDRAARVALLGDAAIALLDGRLPAREACVLLGAALLRRLREGGDLEDILRIKPPRGSKLTAHRIWREVGGDVIGDLGQLGEDARQSDDCNEENP